MLFFFKAFDRRFLREGRRDFQVDPESVRLVLYRSIRVRGGIQLSESYLPVDLVNSE